MKESSELPNVNQKNVDNFTLRKVMKFLRSLSGGKSKTNTTNSPVDQEDESTTSTYANDEATVRDRLNRNIYVDALTKMAIVCQTPMVIGIHGQWGMGKTSIMLQIREQLDKNYLEEVKTVWFSPWQYQFEHSPILALLHSIRAEFGTIKELKKKSVRLIEMVSTLGGELLFTAFTGGKVSLKDMIDLRKECKKKHLEMKTLTQRLKSAYEDYIKALLGDPDKRLIIFIDDLDRCQPEICLRILESLKLYLNAKRCIYFIGIDGHIVECAVEMKYSNEEIKGKDYLQKIVQVPFQIPPIDDETIGSYIATLSKDLGEDFESLQPTFMACVSRNPRQVKRFLNTFRLNDILASKILLDNYDREILIKLLGIQFEDTVLYGYLAEHTPQLIGMERILIDGEEPSEEESGEFYNKYRENERIMNILRTGKRFSEVNADLLEKYFTLTGLTLEEEEREEIIEKRTEKKVEEREIITEKPIAKKPEVFAQVPTSPTPYFAHPYPMQKNFTGREAERNELTEWFTETPEPMFAYIAIGGAGKSALTWYWLHEDIIKQGLAPEGIIWWSFYDKEARFESFLPKAIQYVSKGKIDPKTIDSTRDRMDCLHQLLRDNRFLLVLDGVERVLREYAGLGSPYKGDEVKKDDKGNFRTCVDPNVGTFFQWLTSGDLKTKTLLTSRLCPKELDAISGCLVKKLTKMDKDDAVNFFWRQGAKGTRAEIETVCNFYGYHPLSLRLLSGMIVNDPKLSGDMGGWRKQNPISELKGSKQEHYILELAYNSLTKKKQVLISKLSAFRNPMEYESISIFNEFPSEQEFDDVLSELQDRGLLLRNPVTHRYRLHPIVRGFCYDRLIDKEGVHSQLRDYFVKIPEPEKVESLEDLEPVIELYHHTVNSGSYEEALGLLQERLIPDPLYFRFGAYQLTIELLRALFPDGEDKPPRLKRENDQAWILNELANSYAVSGQPKQTVHLLNMANQIAEKQGIKKVLAEGLGNLAYMIQIPLGDFKSAESNLRRRIKLSQEIKDDWVEAMGHQWLGGLLAYQGKFEESEKELARGLGLFIKEHELQPEGVVWAYRALRALLMSDADTALDAAKNARDLAGVKHFERDIIWAEWLLGAAYLAKGDLKKAEKHLDEALRRDRKINMVDLEADILLELAKLRFIQKRKKEALERANEALQIADRCEYRLKQADVNNFLAEFYLEKKDFSKAKEHADVAKRRAECGYKPALDKAKKLVILVKQKSKQ